MSPGVQVIANYREPIFYSDSYYWRSSGNVWYRSSIHTGGWVRYQAPTAIVRIDPSAYVYYRGSARAATPAHSNAPHATPAMTREDRKDAREDAREERKEAKQEERKEHKNDQNDAKDAKKGRK